MSTRTNTSHQALLNDSTEYADKFETYGAMIPYRVAERFAYQHGASIESLIPEGLEMYVSPITPAKVSLVSLYTTLGY